MVIRLGLMIFANLVILQYLGSPFTWDKVFKVLRPLPNHVKNQRLLVHILYHILFNYLDKMLKTMFECDYGLESNLFTEKWRAEKVMLRSCSHSNLLLHLYKYHLGHF